MALSQHGSFAPAEIQYIASFYQMGAISMVSASKTAQYYLCDRGFIGKMGNTAAQPFRWDLIPAVWRQAKVTYPLWSTYKRLIVTTTYAIQRNDGYTFYLDGSFQYFDILHKNVEAETRQILLPAALQGYAQGQMLPFGPLVLSRQGVSNGRNLLPWQYIESIKIEVNADGEFVLVKQQGAWRAWAKEMTSTIPNLTVFLALVDRALKEHGRR